jgi:CheY-like chemotaxis protein
MLDWNNVTGWTVLLVEDEIDNQEVISETLEYYGLKTKSAQNGVEALATLQDYTPTIIITDLSMPQMDGWTFRSELKANVKWRSIPVIALSAHAMAGDKERALVAGFDGYVTKPINARTIIADLRSAYEEASAMHPEVDVPVIKDTNPSVTSIKVDEKLETAPQDNAALEIPAPKDTVK